MQIIVCGAGKSGSSIAEKLSKLGNEVTIIEVLVFYVQESQVEHLQQKL